MLPSKRARQPRSGRDQNSIRPTETDNLEQGDTGDICTQRKSRAFPAFVCAVPQPFVERRSILAVEICLPICRHHPHVSGPGHPSSRSKLKRLSIGQIYHECQA